MPNNQGNRLAEGESSGGRKPIAKLIVVLATKGSDYEHGPGNTNEDSASLAALEGSRESDC